MDEVVSPILELKDLERFWSAADPAGAEAAYRRLVPAAEKLVGDERRGLSELFSLLARACAAQGKFPEAQLALSRAAELLQEQGEGGAVRAKIRWLLEAGRVHVYEKTPSQARPQFVAAWNQAIDSGEDALAVDVALMMAEIEPQKQQQEWIARAISLAERSSQAAARRSLGILYSTLAWRLFELRQYDAAASSFEKALAHFREHGTAREVFVARWSIAKLVRTRGRAEEALALQRELLTELTQSGQKDGRVYEELAECLHALRRPAEAQPYFELAYQELSQGGGPADGADGREASLRRLKELGKTR